MGERTGPDSGETTLAAATAAIITARWPQSPTNGSAPGHPAGGSSGANGHGPANGHGSSTGSSEWAPPPAPSPAPDPRPSSAPPFAPVSPPGGFLAPPVSPAPTVHTPGGAFGAAGTLFAAVNPDPIPEIFDPAPRSDAGPLTREPGLRPDGMPNREPGPVPAEIRTQVPPGFERRNFGPFPDEPVSPPASGGGWEVPEPRTEIRDHPVSPAGPELPSALLGVVPPQGWSQPSQPTLAPPEPAPWVDTGWVDFGDLGSRSGGLSGDLGSRSGGLSGDLGSRSGGLSGDLGSRSGGLSGDLGSRSGGLSGDPEPVDVLVGAGVGAVPAMPGDQHHHQATSLLPRRVPRPPDLDFPLFDTDPAEPTPDPATERQELSRIADYLRDEAQVADPTQRPDAIDLEAVLGAVRKVPEVRDAQLRWNAQAGHTLRIEFVDGVDESEVTRSVVRLLRSRLGLAAQPSVEESTVDSSYRGRVAVGGARGSTRATAGAPAKRPLPRPSGVDADAPRLVVENVTVTRLGAEATVEVRLRGPRGVAVGEGRGPGVDAYLSRLAATAAAHAVDQALAPANRGKVFIEHVSVVPFGVVEVAVVVLLLTWDEVTEQLCGSAIVGDDPHQAVVRATLAALNRRLESLL